MGRKLREMLPHAAILICNMYIVLFLIDRVNPAMNFIDNGLTKGLLLLLCAIAFVDARALMRVDRRETARPQAPRRAPAPAPRYATSGARPSAPNRRPSAANARPYAQGARRAAAYPRASAPGGRPDSRGARTAAQEPVYRQRGREEGYGR